VSAFALLSLLSSLWLLSFEFVLLKIDKLTWFKIKLVEKVVWAKVTEKRQVLGNCVFSGY